MAGFVGIFLLGVFVAHPKIVFAFFDFISERIPASANPPPPSPPRATEQAEVPHVLFSRIHPDETPHPAGFASLYV
jgi:hypothetical protein